MHSSSKLAIASAGCPMGNAWIPRVGCALLCFVESTHFCRSRQAALSFVQSCTKEWEPHRAVQPMQESKMRLLRPHSTSPKVQITTRLASKRERTCRKNTLPDLCPGMCVCVCGQPSRFQRETTSAQIALAKVSSFSIRYARRDLRLAPKGTKMHANAVDSSCSFEKKERSSLCCSIEIIRIVSQLQDSA